MDNGKISMEPPSGARKCSLAAVVWGLSVTIFSIGSVLCCFLFNQRISYVELELSREQNLQEDRLQEWVQKYVEKEVNRLAEQVSSVT